MTLETTAILSPETHTVITYRLHARHRALSRRPQHIASFLLRLLRGLAARRRRSGPEVWHGSLGPRLHESLGYLHSVTHLGAQAMAADLVAGSHRDAGSRVLSDDGELS